MRLAFTIALLQRYLSEAPLIEKAKGAVRKAYPLEWREQTRGRHPMFVFSYQGKPLVRMNNHAWRSARIRAGLPQVRVHDLRHTFGHRLRASGVSFEDRQDLLGDSSGRITTHYSAPDIVRLLQAVELICEQKRMTILRLAAVAGDNYCNSGKMPFRQKAVLQ